MEMNQNIEAGHTVANPARTQKQTIREQIAAEVATQPSAQVEFLARWLCERDRINPDRVLDENPTRLAWHREDLTAARLLKEIAERAPMVSRVQLSNARLNRVYVAGPMSGMPGHNFPAFNAAAAALRAQGWQVENPADHGVVDGATWADYMHSDVCMLASCGTIHLLPGWSKSRGASLEAHIAAALGMQFQYADGAEPALPVAVHEAVAIVLGELRRAMAKFPTWPTDPLHAVGVLNEEVGELNKELLQLTYEPHKVTRQSVHTEAMQSAAMTLRFLASMERYEFRPCEQHVQGAGIGEGAR